MAQDERPSVAGTERVGITAPELADPLALLERQARERLPEAIYDYYAAGSGPETTLAANLAAWSRLRLRPRVLRDVSTVELSTSVLGEPVAHPILVAPTASHSFAHAEAELATVRGAARAGALMVISTRSNVTLEDLASAVPEAQRWFQVYVMRDRGWTRELLARAAAAGCTALVLTGDTPYVGRKLRPSMQTLRVPDIATANRPSAAPVDEHASWQDPSITFDAIAWLAEESGLPVVVKGVLRGDDARRCVQAGAAAVVVSNHGGRQLDGAIATATALPEVVDAIGDGAEVYVDGGIRSGTDVLRALALGARAAFVGRPVLWGLAVDGADGVANVLELLREQLWEAAALAGAATLAEITPDLIA
jgi:4-hydroxymandelate oxidase